MSRFDCQVRVAPHRGERIVRASAEAQGLDLCESVAVDAHHEGPALMVAQLSSYCRGRVSRTWAVHQASPSRSRPRVRSSSLVAPSAFAHPS